MHTQGSPSSDHCTSNVNFMIMAIFWLSGAMKLTGAVIISQVFNQAGAVIPQRPPAGAELHGRERLHQQPGVEV